MTMHSDICQQIRSVISDDGYADIASPTRVAARARESENVFVTDRPQEGGWGEGRERKL